MNFPVFHLDFLGKRQTETYQTWPLERTGGMFLAGGAALTMMAFLKNIDSDFYNKARNAIAKWMLRWLLFCLFCFMSVLECKVSDIGMNSI